MRINLNFLLSIFFLFYFVPARSSNITPNSGCDTIITKMGQVILVHILSSSDEQTVRFNYCGDEKSTKFNEISRNNISEIRKTSAPAESQAAKQHADTIKVSESLPVGSAPIEQAQMEVPLEIPKDSKPVQLETPVSPKSISMYAKIAAIGGFGSLFLVVFAMAFNPFVLILVLPFSIVGLVFSSMVLKRTKKRKAEFMKHRRLAKWSMAMSISWVALTVIYILLLILFFFIFFI